MMYWTGKRLSWALVAGGVIAAAVLLAYAGSFSGPFVFDDVSSIAENPTIRTLWPPGMPLSPPHGDETVNGRPLLNLSFALNFAAGGLSVRGYHAVNVAIHLCAALALFGLVRRSLALPQLRERFGAAALPLAAAVALLWALHPLQTESVTYVVQRAESLMGLFYLFSLNAFVRAIGNGPRPAWGWLAVAACFCGVATKEVMVSAPLTALILDRTFVSGSFREAFRRHGRLYLGLAASWVLLGFLIAQGGTRGGSTGFGIGVPVTGYWLTQFPAIIRYLRLAAWPSPLIFDYGFEDRWIAHPMWVLPYAVAIAVLAAAVAVALWRGWATGFLGFWFFSILAPTSLIPGGRQTAAEHRMYVALAPVAVFAVCGLYAVLRRRLSGRTLVWAGGAGCVVVAVALGLATARRNKAYSSEIALWQDTLQKFRNSPFAHNGIGTALSRAGRMNEAEREFREALRLKPDYFEAGYNLGVSLVGEGRFAEAKLCFEQVLSVKPTLAEAQNNLGSLLRKEGRRGEALAHYEKAVRLKPESAAFHINYAGTLVQENHPAEAIPEFRMALRFEPENAAAHEGLGVALGLTGRPAEALPELQTAVSLSPSDIESHRNLAYIYRQLGREAEAKTELERAAKLGAGGDQPAR